MEVDEKKIEEALNHITLSQKKCVSLKSWLTSVEIPEDEEFGTMDLSGVNSIAVSTEKDAEKLIEQLITVINNIRKAEQDSSGSGLRTGDSVSLASGDKYYETGLGEGDWGVAGSAIRPEGDDYIVDRFAFYVDGRLVANINETGTDIQECRMKYAEQYGVDISEVEVSLHVSYEGDKATGWLDRSNPIYDQLNKSSQKGQYDNNVEINIEKALEDINKKYDNTESDTIQNKIVQIDVNEYNDTIQPVSFGATVGASAANVGGGVLNFVTGPVDLATNLVTLGHGTDLTQIVTDMEEGAELYYNELGAADVSDYRTIQEISGEALVSVALLGIRSPKSGADEVPIEKVDLTKPDPKLLKKQKIAKATMKGAKNTAKTIDTTEDIISVYNLVDNND